MRIKCRTNLGSNDFPGMPFLEGEEHDVTDIVGAKLVTLRLADDVTPLPEPVAVEAKLDAEAIRKNEPITTKTSPASGRRSN